MACLKINVSKKYDKAKVSCTLVYSKAKVSCALVCSNFNSPYLIVTPEAIQWISEYTAAEYLIKSNVDWTIFSK